VNILPRKKLTLIKPLVAFSKDTSHKGQDSILITLDIREVLSHEKYLGFLKEFCNDFHLMINRFW